MTENPKNIVYSVAKAFSVLRAFGPELPELTVTEAAGRAELDRGTAFRLVHTLVQLGYLAAVPRSRRFRLTLKCLELGYTPLARADLKTLSRPLLRELVPDSADAASLGMLADCDVVYVERIQGDVSRSSLDRRVGSRTGAYAAALGHAILGFLPADEQIALLSRSDRVKLSEHTVVDLDQLLGRLRQVRDRGYAVSDGENAYGLRTVAAPIFDMDGRPIAGVSATIRAERMDLQPFLAQAVPQVRQIAGDLTEAIRLSFGAIAQYGR